MDVCTGRVLGEHLGLFRYTIGQRAKVGALPERLFVLGKHRATNQLVVGPVTHPALTCGRFCVDRVAWTAGGPPDQGIPNVEKRIHCDVRFRHQQILLPATIVLGSSQPIGCGTTANGAAASSPDAATTATRPAPALQTVNFGLEALGFVPGCNMSEDYGRVRDTCVGRGGAEVVAALADSFRAVAPGQTAVLYSGDVCLGAGTIAAALPSTVGGG